MKTLKLSPRLSALARLAASGKRITDVGTDHGYLSVWLALHGCAESITATDIRNKPLESAMRSAREHGVSEKIRFVLCDGLDFSGAPDSDTVIIAGMGGETIISILERAPWTKAGVCLLLQPQSKLDELCVWLAENGYAINDAALVEDAGRLYVTLSVQGAEAPSGVVFVEDILLRNRDALLNRWLCEHISALEKAESGMLRAKEEKTTDTLLETLGRLMRIKEEMSIWRQ